MFAIFVIFYFSFLLFVIKDLRDAHATKEKREAMQRSSFNAKVYSKKKKVGIISINFFCSTFTFLCNFL